MSKQHRPPGVVLWEGESLWDGKPIVCIAVLRSDNVKTGDMVQTYIIRSDVDPLGASKSGADASVCGECPHRRGHGELKDCYVNLGHGPRQVFMSYEKGNYPAYDAALHDRWFKGRKIRFGAYGDPAMVPVEVWENLSRLSGGWTGYTHQWKQCSREYRRYLMASCDSVEEQRCAQAEGWRTFRIRTPDEPHLLKGEFVCPASPEGGDRLQCETCLACNGNAKGEVRRGGHVAIVIHGTFKARQQQKIVMLTIAGGEHATV